MALTTSLRIITWNVWHALSPYGWGGLGPLAMPRLESAQEASLRQMRQVEAMLKLRETDFDVFCLQEINPVERRSRLLAEELEMRAAPMRCNAGIKLGGFGLPLHLSEGLLMLTGKGFKKRKIVRVSLSGKAYEWQTPIGLPVFIQLSERRCAMMVESLIHGRRVAIVNLHLHHGHEQNKDVFLRRKHELSRLARFLKRRAQEVDLLVVCGDFNGEADSKALKPLLELGLVDTASLEGKKQKPTWDPRRNPLTRTSAHLAIERFQEGRGWQSQSHVFDRIYLRSRAPLKAVNLKRVCDEPLLSDHYGVLAEITF